MKCIFSFNAECCLEIQLEKVEVFQKSYKLNVYVSIQTVLPKLSKIEYQRTVRDNFKKYPVALLWMIFSHIQSSVQKK